MDAQLREWALWKRALAAGTGPGVGSERPGPAGLDVEIARLPADLVKTLVQVYLHDGDRAEHVRRLGCPEWTITRRLGRADRLLVEALRASVEQARERRLFAPPERCR